MPEDKIISKGIGLYEKAEWEELQKLADKYRATLHGMTVYAIRHFLKEVKAGNVKIVQETKLGKP